MDKKERDEKEARENVMFKLYFLRKIATTGHRSYSAFSSLCRNIAEGPDGSRPGVLCLSPVRGVPSTPLSSGSHYPEDSRARFPAQGNCLHLTWPLNGQNPINTRIHILDNPF